MRKALASAIGVLLVTAASFSENLFDLALSGTPAQVRQALEGGERVVQRDEGGNTPLMYAAHSNPDPEVVAALLEAGAPIDDRNEKMTTALMHAAGHNLNPKVISILLGAGGTIDARDVDGNTPIVYAAENNQNPDVVSTLLRAGADVGQRDQAGSTVLMHAAGHSQNADVISVLLRAGAALDARDNYFNTALFYAAARNSNTAVLDSLLKAGADVETRNDDGKTPLMIAGQYNQNPDVISVLVKAGALIGDRDRGGVTPLMWAAAYNRNPEMIAALVKAGAKVDEPDARGRTALMIAASYTEEPEVVEALLRAGADTKARDHEGRTAFNCAQENKNLDDTKARWDLDFTHRLASGLLIVQYRFSDIYPVFYGYYDTHPLGQVVIMNTLDKPVTDVRMTFFVKEFMRAPRVCPVPSTFLPNEPATADLFAVLEPSILLVTENMKAQAEVTLEYEENGRQMKKVIPYTFPILKRNAIDWSDTRRTAAFISPSDPTVLRFSKNVSAAFGGRTRAVLDPNLHLTMAMHAALQLRGLAYSQDPIPVLTPNRNVADFIQFPRQTLDNRSGKCSDLSVLYSSLLEAVGIETALITTPGHIFMAIALTLSQEEARRFFGHPDDLIFREGKAWLPLEVTMREGGFLAAWQRGAEEWRENEAQGRAEFYPTRESWKYYEPVALPGTEPTLSFPTEKELAALVQEESERFVDREISVRVTALEAQISRAADSSRPRNDLGVLYARYGLHDRAETQFREAIARKDYAPALVNLGNISYLKGDIRSALDYYQRASLSRPTSASALLGLALTHRRAGDGVSASKAYLGLKTVDPELAAKFSYLETAGETATRASGSGDGLIWEED